MKGKNWQPTTPGWVVEPICTSPYDVGPYGTGLYGRCKIVSNLVWRTDVPCVIAPIGAPASAPRKPGRAHG